MDLVLFSWLWFYLVKKNQPCKIILPEDSTLIQKNPERANKMDEESDCPLHVGSGCRALRRTRLS